MIFQSYQIINSSVLQINCIYIATDEVAKLRGSGKVYKKIMLTTDEKPIIETLFLINSCMLQEETPKIFDKNVTDQITDNDNNDLVDLIVGGISSLLITIGVIGNIPFFCHFLKIRNKTIHDLLYMTISVLHGLTSAITFPVIVSLLNSRSPILFQIPTFCTSWPVLFSLLMRVSMVVVVLISVSRTVTILFPSKMPRILEDYSKKTLLGVLGYAALLATIDVVCLTKGVIQAKYFAITSACDVISPAVELTCEWSKVTPAFWAYWFIYQLELILPCVIVFASFLVSTSLLLRRKNVLEDDEKTFKRVSITIALSTALFLVCYLPCFLLQVTYFVSMFHPIDAGKGFRHYLHLLSQFHLPLLNSAANPCLCLSRMPRYRKWLVKSFRGQRRIPQQRH